MKYTSSDFFCLRPVKLLADLDLVRTSCAYQILLGIIRRFCYYYLYFAKAFVFGY